ncbi:hypothetical protein Enr13x_24130 [Stieleria neptunia]|uniref:GspL periplasmic domain protein n=1 Tax=Stieleria neptunia TaxID=2527979 RepID=A0A518HP00_9BACT|nr:hypothetical protein [Stieleria neptunia]QDV42565.1 hypothetical protein Enr13x_24130 [Stieleria neptunia]
MIVARAVEPYLICVSREEDPNPAVSLEAGEMLDHVLVSHGSAVISLPSNGCFSFVRCHDVSRRWKRRDQIVFDLEECIPVDAECIAFDRIRSGTGNLLVATDSSELCDAIETLEEEGVHVAAIVPNVFLALSSVFRTHPKTRSLDFILIESETGLDLIRLESGTPAEWYWLGEDQEIALRWMGDAMKRTGAASLVFVNITQLSPESIDNHVDVSEVQLDLAAAIAGESERIADGRAKPIFDLRDGPLKTKNKYRPIQKPLLICMVAVALLQTALLAAILIRVTKLQHHAEVSLREQEDVFGRVFPDERIPVGISSRLQSEHRRLLGTRGVGGKPIPVLKSSLPVAYAFLEGLPERSAAKFEFSRMEFEVDRIREAVGVAKTYADQETVATMLRKSGLDVPQLSAESVRGGVSLRLENVRFLDPPREEE